MKLNQICLLILSLFYIASVQSADVLIRLSGTVSANTCAISTGTQEQYINLGRWASKQFSSAGVKTTPVKFTIDLTNCNGSLSGISGTTVTFSGTADSKNDNLLALDAQSGATNIGIGILDRNRQLIAPNHESSVYILDPNSNNISLVFYGQYVSTSTPVVPGTANADVIFALTYQ